MSSIDARIIRHLDAWLDGSVLPDYRERVRARMLELVNDDPEYWLSQGWQRVYDNADCGYIE